jgi:predicted regulator of Ras-like GTPase activity (Roadblock/LC7/MglB family)
MIANGIVGYRQRGRIATPALERALREVARRVPDLHWATIASLDGVVQATYDPFCREQHDRIQALVSSVLSLGERVFRKLQRGELSYLTLAGDTGVIVVRPVGKAYILAISIPPSTETSVAVGTLAQMATVLEVILGQTMV